jgi:hypothetical protein
MIHHQLAYGLTMLGVLTLLLIMFRIDRQRQQERTRTGHDSTSDAVTTVHLQDFAIDDDEEDSHRLEEEEEEEQADTQNQHQNRTAVSEGSGSSFWDTVLGSRSSSLRRSSSLAFRIGSQRSRRTSSLKKNNCTTDIEVGSNFYVVTMTTATMTNTEEQQRQQSDHETSLEKRQQRRGHNVCSSTKENDYDGEICVGDGDLSDIELQTKENN